MTALSDIVHHVLSDAETSACIKMLLRWQGCYDADKLESDTHLVRGCHQL